MALSRSEILFGRIAMHNGLLSQEQLDECAGEKKRGASDQDLGDIILKMGYLSPKQFKAVNSARDKHLKKKQAAASARGVPAPSAAADFEVVDETPARSASSQSGGDFEVVDQSSSKAQEPEPPSGINVAVAKPSSLGQSGADGIAPSAIAVEEEGLTAGDSVVGGRSVPPRCTDPIVKEKLVALLRAARKRDASDLHLSANAKPFLRIHGRLTELTKEPVCLGEVTEQLVGTVINDAEWKHYMKTSDLDTCVDLGELGRFRTNVFHQRRGTSAVFRIIKDRVPTLEELGLPEVIERLTTFHQGLVLVTGSSGSGKSSTLAALINIINNTRKENIITLEDPIEYVFKARRCNIIQRQIDLHTKSWANALRASLREDPDVIMVGEMRDLETVSLAITAAETGHLVLGTLHTTNATRTIDRILDVFPPKEQAQIRAMVSESLKGVISQQLIPRKDGKGRVAATEIMFWTPAVANLIREKQSFKLTSVLQTGKARGMRLMDDSLKELVKSGMIDLSEARARAVNPKAIT